MSKKKCGGSPLLCAEEQKNKRTVCRIIFIAHLVLPLLYFLRQMSSNIAALDISLGFICKLGYILADAFVFAMIADRLVRGEKRYMRTLAVWFALAHAMSSFVIRLLQNLDAMFYEYELSFIILSSVLDTLLSDVLPNLIYLLLYILILVWVLRRTPHPSFVRRTGIYIGIVSLVSLVQDEIFVTVDFFISAAGTVIFAEIMYIVMTYLLYTAFAFGAYIVSKTVLGHISAKKDTVL